MNNRAWVIALAIAVGVTVLSGVIQGVLVERWGRATSHQLAAERLASGRDSLQRALGDWQFRGSRELDAQSVGILENPDYIICKYGNEKTGTTIDATLLLGITGPIAAHTPEICIGVQSYRLQGGRKELAVPDRDDRFWACSFLPTKPENPPLRVYYAWGTGGPWTAPGEPRLAFAGGAYLYKMQLSICSANEARADEACLSFLKEFLPAVKACLRKPKDDSAPPQP